MSLSIHEVRSKADLERFIQYPFDLYRDDPAWVPPIRAERRHFFHRERNAFFAHAEAAIWLAERGGKVVGTIGASVDEYQKQLDEKDVGCFGFFECDHDEEVAAALFATAEEWLQERGCNKVRGPFNFSINHECGLLVDNFEQRPILMLTHNRDYFPKLVEAQGYGKAMDLFAYHRELSAVPEGLRAAGERALSNPAVTVRKVRISEMRKEAERVWDIYNRAWSRNWGFVPFDKNEFTQAVKGIAMILNPQLAFIAEYEGEPIGFAVSLPDVNEALHASGGRMFPTGWWKLLRARKRAEWLRVFVLGIVPEYQDIGLGAAFYLRTWEAALRLGFQKVDMSWILENNEPMNRALQMMGAEVYKTYRIYEKSL